MLVWCINFLQTEMHIMNTKIKVLTLLCCTLLSGCVKENEISVVRQDIQDDSDVEGDIYTIDNDEFILKEENGYLKMTCMGPG